MRKDRKRRRSISVVRSSNPFCNIYSKSRQVPSPSYIGSSNNIASNKNRASSSTSRQLLQASQPTIKDVTIATIGISIRILPNSLIRPPARNRPRPAAAIPRQDQRTSGMKRGSVPRAGRPPIIGAVDQGIPRRLAVVGVDEVLDPSDHCRLGQAITCRARGIIFDIQHSWQGNAVSGPTATVGEEVVRLRGAGAGIRVGEMISTADQACGGCATVVRGEA